MSLSGRIFGTCATMRDCLKFIQWRRCLSRSDVLLEGQSEKRSSAHRGKRKLRAERLTASHLQISLISRANERVYCLSLNFSRQHASTRRCLACDRLGLVHFAQSQQKILKRIPGRSRTKACHRFTRPDNADPHPYMDRRPVGANEYGRAGCPRLPVRFLPSIRPTVIAFNELICVS
jgi:hypothetical protein